MAVQGMKQWLVVAAFGVAAMVEVTAIGNETGADPAGTPAAPANALPPRDGSGSDDTPWH
jgi:hypothetical protein